MTTRDRYVIIVVAALAVVGAFWFMGLSPKRQKIAKLDKDIATAQQSVQTAEQEKAQFAQAQVRFPTLYASVGRLGKAVPADEDVPSLLVQLNHAASKSGVDFRSIELKVDKNAQAAAAAAPPPAAGASSSGAAAGTSAPAAGSSAPAGSASPASSGSAAPAGSATPAASGASTGASSDAAAAAPTLQPLPFEYKFEGNFFQLKRMIGALADMVETHNSEVAATGRLISVDGFSLSGGDVTILATSYLLPAGQSLLGGATASGPAGADPNAPQPAAAASPSASPTPTAAVTTP